ncbi:MAG: type I-E CRISPR-associated protein Cas5/CasD [Chloroflexi bacterium]|nr:MAG: type I-E CRISPR-associated protein Cas5/CasD [Chloroflexota bacterium]
MSVLLMRLSGPMQAWGVQSRFGVRDTGREPSKSGVVGLLAAALGRPRQAPVADLAALRMGVRVDREGVLLRDYHTAQNVYRAKGGVKDTELSTRYFLADAAFLVGLEGDETLLNKLFAALRDPQWSLFLGRRAFVPGEPIWLSDGLRGGALEAELHPSATPWLTGIPNTYPLVRMVIEDYTGSEVRTDQPLSFHPRRFAPRRVINEYRNLELSV